MNRSTSTYCQIYANITYNGAISRLTSTGNDPRKGWRIPLNEIKYNEQRDEETGYGYFGARFMDHELMTTWLSVDPMSDMAVGYTNFRTGFSVTSTVLSTADLIFGGMIDERW